MKKSQELCGISGRAYIKCTLIDPDVRSMLHKMPPRETNAGGRYQGIWGRRAEELTAAKVPIKDVSKSDETRFSRSDGSLLFRYGSLPQKHDKS